MITSPWLPTVFVRLAQSSQLMISFGFAGAEMSMRRKPAYVPWTAVLPQKARSELKLPAPGTVLSSGISRGENPSGCMFFVYVNVETAAMGRAEAANGNVSMPTRTATASKSRSFRTATSLGWFEREAHAEGRRPSSAPSARDSPCLPLLP
jgi:hypothetical protein